MIYKKCVELIDENKSFVLATIIKTQGASPRHSSSKMLLCEDGEVYGSVGGGMLELKVIEEARECMKNKKNGIYNYILDEDKSKGIHMFCGGQVEVYLEYNEPQIKLLLVGGGNVNASVAEMAKLLDYKIIVLDTREEFCEKYKEAAVESYMLKSYKDICKEYFIDKYTAIVIATQDADNSALEAVIRSEAFYIGMIGSRRKAALIKNTLLQQGVEQELVDKVHSPMGIYIGAETPQEIALSILSEIVKVKKGVSY